MTDSGVKKLLMLCHKNSSGVQTAQYMVANESTASKTTFSIEYLLIWIHVPLVI